MEKEVYRRYGDIIDLPHPVSKTHKPMSRLDRAAQFSPFAALSGYDEAIDEAARYTEGRIELSEEEKLELGRRIGIIAGHIGKPVPIELVYFRPDESKPGGMLVKVTTRVKKVLPLDRIIITEDGTRLPFDDIISLNGSLLDIKED